MTIEHFSRIYRALLHTYPRQFRMEFGGEMEQLFRDQCRDVARTNNPMKMLYFIVNSVADWIKTSVRERTVAAPRGLVNEWIVTILVYLFASTTLVQAYVIPTGSMEGNLRVGDHMLVDRAAYAKPGPLGRYVMPYEDVKRGDIVAFLYPVDTHQTFAKRVIGLPGDRISMVDKQVIRNGSALIEPYTQHIDPGIDPSRDNLQELTVPQDKLFVLGDNRDNSLDSRYWGFVPRENVVGKAAIRLLVLRCADCGSRTLECRASGRCHGTFFNEDALGPNFSGAAMTGMPTGLPHLVRTILLALAISAVVAALGRRNLRERLSHACWLFASCVASVIAGSWIMYLIHG